MLQASRSRFARKAVATVATSAPTFKNYDDFIVAYNKARWALIAEVGENWHLYPQYYVWARLPLAWVQTRVAGRLLNGELGDRWSTSSRDHRLPIARFWPSGELPVGPEYAEPIS
jgi:hypothetical protein